MPKHKLTTTLNNQDDVAALQKIAEQLGFIQLVGGGVGQGSIGGLIQAIARLPESKLPALAKALEVELKEGE